MKAALGRFLNGARPAETRDGYIVLYRLKGGVWEVAEDGWSSIDYLTGLRPRHRKVNRVDVLYVKAVGQYPQGREVGSEALASGDQDGTTKEER